MSDIKPVTTVRMLSLEELRAQRGNAPIKSKPSVTITHTKTGFTKVRFATKPDASVRARLLAADFAWNFQSRTWVSMETTTDEQVNAIIRGS